MNDIVIDANKTMDVDAVVKSIKLARLKNLAKYRVHVIVRDFIPADKLLAFLRELKQTFGEVELVLMNDFLFDVKDIIEAVDRVKILVYLMNKDYWEKNISKYKNEKVIFFYVIQEPIHPFLDAFGDFIIHYELQKYKNILLIIPHYVRVEWAKEHIDMVKKHGFFTPLGDVKIIELKEVDDVWTLEP